MSKYEIHWRDFNSPLTRNEIFAVWPLLSVKIFDLPLTRMGIISQKNDISYFADMKAMAKSQKILRDRIRQNPMELKRLIDLTEKWGRELNCHTEKIANADLSKWTVAKLIAAHKKYVSLQTRQYAVGVNFVVMDVSMGVNSLDNEVRRILGKFLRNEEFELAYHAFTTPARDSFSREQEKELLKIYDKFGISGLGFNLALSRHTKKWAWVYYAYGGPAWVAKDFVAIIKDWQSRKLSPAKIKANWDKERREVIGSQKYYLKNHSFTDNEKMILTQAADVVWSKPRRKDYQSKSYWHLEHFYHEVARRLGASLKEVRSMPVETMFKALKTGNYDQAKIYEIYNYHVVYSKGNKVYVVTGDKAKKFAKTVKDEKIVIKGNEFVGSSACSGKATGFACIINSADDLYKMKEGNILVSVATTPSIVSAMRKAAAIVTDEGGLTCHAAIVSRELNIPCVVGLKVITKAVKDGDRLEVDANKGVVKKIK